MTNSDTFLPSRNPLPLSSAQEAQVNELYYKRVRNLCASEIRGIALLGYDLPVLSL